MIRPVIDFNVAPQIPERIAAIKELAYNFWWSWRHQADELFRRIDEDIWIESEHNPVLLLGRVGQDRLQELCKDEGFITHLDEVFENYYAYMNTHTWYNRKYGVSDSPLYAYFSMEFGINKCMRIYSGGLGILAGDHLKSASDLGLPLVAVGLCYQQGYFRQYLNPDGWQQERYSINDFYNMPIQQVLNDDGSPLVVEINMLGRPLRIIVWLAKIGRVNLYLLDTNLPENGEDFRWITGQLYGGDREMRIRQEIVLGIGGYRFLSQRGVDPAVCHMNEGHSAFLALERIRTMMNKSDLDFDQARTICASSNNFTTHTSVPAGFDLFSCELMERYFTDYIRELGIDMGKLLSMGRGTNASDGEPFNMAFFAMHNTSRANSVSKLHGEVTRNMVKGEFPNVPLDEIPVIPITNGIHTRTWITPDMAELLTRYLGPGWTENGADPDVWEGVDRIPNPELWRTHARRRERLVSLVRSRLQRQLEQRKVSKDEISQSWEVLDPRALTIGFARRFATYKRAILLFSDIERIERILSNTDYPVQLIFAGKAHPADDYAKNIIKDIVHFLRRPGMRDHVVFIEDYDMGVARYMVGGVDVWLNTPRRPLEASGTSGMKVLPNGGLNCSVLDGWWAEAYNADVGWAIGAGEQYSSEEMQDQVESNALYDLLEKEIIPTFYTRTRDGIPRRWVEMMKESMKQLCPVFTTDRMVQEYLQKMYQPTQAQYHELTKDNYAGGREYASWVQKINEKWSEVQVVEVLSDVSQTQKIDYPLEVSAVVHMGSLSPEDLKVEIYAGVLDEKGVFKNGEIISMSMVEKRDGSNCLYCGEYKSHNVGRHGIGIRVTPYHPLMAGNFVLPYITWA